jgi:hypothetical protein
MSYKATVKKKREPVPYSSHLTGHYYALLDLSRLQRPEHSNGLNTFTTLFNHALL